jgi:hypothetical protein
MKVNSAIWTFTQIVKELEAHYKELGDEIEIDVLSRSELEEYFEPEEIKDVAFGVGIWWTKKGYYEPIYVVYEDGEIKKVSWF